MSINELVKLKPSSQMTVTQCPIMMSAKIDTHRQIT